MAQRAASEITIAATGLTPGRVARLRRLLLAWGDEYGQDFPWRDARNPYWALVAGVASQQTQMARVLPLWERWTAAFLAQKGFDPREWPEAVVKRVGTLNEVFRFL